MNKKPLLVIFLTVFIDLVGFGIIIPLSPYLARVHGATPFEIGLLMAVYSAMQFVFSPLWGRLSDRIGRRPVLLISIAGTACAHFLFYFGDTLVLLFVARIFAGLFGANISTAMAYIADVTQEKNRSKNMGLIGAAFGLGFICGPVLGGVFSGGQYGESFPALIAAFISLVNFCFAFFVLRESLPKENLKSAQEVVQKKSRFKNIFEKFQKPVVGSLLFGMFVSSFSMANMEATLFLFVQDKFSWSTQTASYGFAYVGVCIAVTQGFLVRKILPQMGERYLLILGLIFFTLGMGLIGISPSVPFLAVAMTIMALGSGFISPSFNGSLSLLSSSAEQGEVMGVGQALAALARILGPPTGGLLYAHVSMAAPFLFASVLGAVGFFTIWIVKAKIPIAARH